VNVLEAPPPRFAADEVGAIAARLFGVEGAATSLGSERDQTFLIDDGAGGGGVIKISNLGEDPAVLDLETEAITHLSSVDAELPVARPGPAVGPANGAAAYRPTVEGADGLHFVRLFERMHGHVGGPELDDCALADAASTHARLNLALRGFFNAAAGRKLLWDLKHAAEVRPLLASIADTNDRRVVAQVLDRFEERVVPRLPSLRSQVVHGDFTLDNVFLDEHDRIAGIVDFGDICHTPQVADFAVGLASLLRGRLTTTSSARRIAIDGHARRFPFEQEGRGAADPVAASCPHRRDQRLAVCAIRRTPSTSRLDADSWRLLKLFASVGADDVAIELRHGATGVSRARTPPPAVARLGPHGPHV
jgi:Ser/Thr protein kinase RdoA (MazF antagonist)